MTKNSTLSILALTASASVIMLAVVFMTPHFAHAASCGSSIAGPDGLTYGSLVGSDGNCWLDRNLGATRVATAFDDYQAYGSMFQWGRLADGHEQMIWTSSSAGTPVNGTTAALSSTDNPGINLFIMNESYPYDWRSPQNDNLWQGVNGINNPCPIGFRLPTQAEWSAVVVADPAITNSTNAFSSSLKLVMAGYHNYSDGSLGGQSTLGGYWSSSFDGAYANFLLFDSNNANIGSINRAFGLSVRCMSPIVPPIITITPGLATSSLSYTSVTLNATTTVGLATTTIEGFNYGSSLSYGSIASTTNLAGFTSGPFSLSISGLTCNTLYHFQAFASSTAGLATSSDMTFSTNACTVPTVTVQPASSITPTEAILNGTISTDGGVSSTITGFAWGTDASYGATTTTTGTYGLGVFSAHVSSLKCNATYHYAPYSVNSIGTSTYPADTTFTTAVCPNISSSHSGGQASAATLRALGLSQLITANTPGYDSRATPPIVGCPTGYVCKATSAIPNPNAITNSNTPSSLQGAPASQSNASTFSRDLTYKSSGSDVTALQSILYSTGFLKVSPTGYYGPLTVTAVRAYQKAHNIPTTGTVGPMTKAAMGN